MTVGAATRNFAEQQGFTVSVTPETYVAEALVEALGAGCVLTGGGALLAGLMDNAESLLRVPTRIGSPVPLSRMPQELSSPEFSVAIGMLLYTHRTQVRRASEEQGLRAKLRAIFAGSY